MGILRKKEQKREFEGMVKRRGKKGTLSKVKEREVWQQLYRVMFQFATCL